MGDFVKTHYCKLCGVYSDRAHDGLCVLINEILSKLTFASCVVYSDRAHYGLCVLIKDISRRLPLQPQCSYQGRQGNVCQSVLENNNTRFRGGQNLTAAERNASVYQVNSVSRTTGEERAEFLRKWGAG